MTADNDILREKKASEMEGNINETSVPSCSAHDTFNQVLIQTAKSTRKRWNVLRGNIDSGTESVEEDSDRPSRARGKRWILCRWRPYMVNSRESSCQSKLGKVSSVVSELSVPILANGDVFKYENIEELRKISGASSFLVARGALANASIFLKEGPLPVDQVVRAYLEISAEVDNVFQNTNYNVMRMIPNSLDDSYATMHRRPSIYPNWQLESTLLPLHLRNRSVDRPVTVCLDALRVRVDVTTQHVPALARAL
ncbi:hypothetical protein PsorP6_012546 [Peronosclerospora sorghi]|uniref:Uncharacterized protein n=1 Tax=Peronosclerospora sorghi TaxID=230839 RepID=A0ACC0WH17_9STRA|nr:hypothetical protein PsorP6_012546 [Peronosclerospora sorghi]